MPAFMSFYELLLHLRAPLDFQNEEGLPEAISYPAQSWLHTNSFASYNLNQEFDAFLVDKGIAADLKAHTF